MLWGRLQTVKIKAGSLGYGQGPSQSRHGAKTFSGRYDSFLRRPSLPGPLLEAGLRMFSASPKTWATDLDRIFVHGDCVLRGLRHHDTGYRHHETQATDKSDKPRPTGKKTPHAARSGAVALILDGHGQMRGPFSQYERHDGDEVDRAEDEDWRNPGSAFRLH
ncbi:hypothetical protein AALT_g2604 [Alternaria alternata]|nr:hypothetical protein AALT_g2604 [Alternaria alternata]